MSKEIEIINQLEDLISDRLSFITDDKETSEIYQRDINAIKGIIELNKQLKENYEAVLRQRDDITKNATETIEKYQEKIDLYKQALLDIKEYINNLGGKELMRISNLQICDVLEIVNKTLGSDKQC